MKQIPQGMQEVMFEKSIPGQSLTNSPENNYAWEKPPQYTSVKEAREAIFLNLLEPKTLKSVQELMITDAKSFRAYYVYAYGYCRKIWNRTYS